MRRLALGVKLIGVFCCLAGVSVVKATPSHDLVGLGCGWAMVALGAVMTMIVFKV